MQLNKGHQRLNPEKIFYWGTQALGIRGKILGQELVHLTVFGRWRVSGQELSFNDVAGFLCWSWAQSLLFLFVFIYASPFSSPLIWVISFLAQISRSQITDLPPPPFFCSTKVLTQGHMHTRQVSVLPLSSIPIPSPDLNFLKTYISSE